MSRQTQDITGLLQEWDRNPQEVVEKVLPLVYAELARIASSSLRRERRDHTLQTGDLVHEAYLRLVDQNRVGWRSRSHFLAIAAQAMRRVLVDHARRQRAAKRIHPELLVSLENAPEPSDRSAVDVVALDEALEQLAALDPRQAQVVELRAFVGLTQQQVAEVLDLSESTVSREWRTAKLWLKRNLRQREGAARQPVGTAPPADPSETSS